jgi:hypothetical protein
MQTPVDGCLDALDVDISMHPAARRQSPSPRERLLDGAGGIGRLFAPVTRTARMWLTACALAACAYYFVAVALWLWALQDGMTALETQAGVVLVVAALVAAWIVGRCEERFPSAGGTLVRLPRSVARERQPLLHLVLDAYRVGVVLQLLAFGGFVLT